MKKYVVFLFVILFTNNFSQSNVSPQFSELKGMEDQQGKRNILSNEILNLYPLSIGNKWVYLIKDVTWPVIHYYVGFTEVLCDTIAPNGKVYFYLKEYENHYQYESHYLERVDSLDGKVYRYYESQYLPDNEYVVADLLGEVGDTTITFYPPGFEQSLIIVERVDTFYNWGLAKLSKHYWQYLGMGYKYFSFTEDIGIDTSTIAIATGYWVTSALKGCIISRVVYGDTTTVGVDDEENPIASEFILEQNYPNPFNPSTVISYRLPVTSNVTLKVYDILGNEIATLVNEEKPAGEYEVEFNVGTSRDLSLSSGIYFYQLKTGSFTQTKKMILLK